MIDESAADIIESIGVELVSRLAPEELPLFPELAQDFRRNGRGRGQGTSKDQMLGFGVAEAMMLLTPVILEFAKGFWDAIAQQAGDTVSQAVGTRLLERFRKPKSVPGHDSKNQDIVAFTPDQARKVHDIAAQQARRLRIPDEQARLLADAMAGVLLLPRK